MLTGASLRHALGAIVLGAALALVSCGGDDKPTTPGSSYDVATLAKQAFGRNPAAATGRVQGRVETSVAGVRGFEEPIVNELSGPFRYREGSALPDYEITLGVRDRGAKLSALGGRPYISIYRTGYALPGSIRQRLLRSSARGRNGLMRTLEQFGIAPWRWETHQRVAGTEAVDGVKTVRVETGVDVARFLRDANTLAGLLTSLGITRAVGLPPRIPARARRILADSVRSAHGASWIALSDKVMRKARLRMRFVVPKARRAQLSGITEVTVRADLEVSQVGRPHPISLPPKSAPYRDFALLMDAQGDFEDARSGR